MFTFNNQQLNFKPLFSTRQFPQGKLFPRALEFFEMMDFYAEYWSEWVESGTCMLSEQEVFVVNSYLNTGRHQESGKNLKLSQSRIHAIFKRARGKLSTEKYRYEIWLKYRELEKLKELKEVHFLGRFLNLPLDAINMDYSLKKKLQNLKINTFCQLLIAFNEESLRANRGFGKRTVEKLKFIMKENKCLHLFRTSKISSYHPDIYIGLKIVFEQQTSEYFSRRLSMTTIA